MGAIASDTESAPRYGHHRFLLCFPTFPGRLSSEPWEVHRLVTLIIMKGQGFKIFLIAFFVVLSGWYLYPTVRSYFINQRLNSLEGEARVEYERENFQTIQKVNQEAIKLGLDLQGGMQVSLELRVDALIRELATDPDQTFEEVLAAAHEEARLGNQSIVDAFVAEFERRDPNVRLSRYFRNEARGITRRSSNSDVQAYLRAEADEAVNRAIEIIRQRVDRFGVTEPSIQKQGTRRVVVELPGVDDAERVRRLLRGTARLEFHLMADPGELQRSLQRIVEHYQTAEADTTARGAAAQDLATADTSAAAPGDTAFNVGDIVSGGVEQQASTGNPLLDVLQPVGQGVQFGFVAERDTAAANQLLSAPEVQAMLPTGVTLMYTSSPVATMADGTELYALLGVRKEVELTGDVITDARVEFSQTNQPEVSMTMNAEGASDWARITGANVNRPIAIVLDNLVYSYPTVINRIPNGRSSITGLESQQEAQDVVTILKSGALPAPMEIVEEQIVGPSLGQAAVRAGVICLIVGFFTVALLMVLYYRTAGLVANLALFTTIFLIFGVLAAFNATLTLPGIAGIVLTMGMAVDANVLIYERVREELATGKSMKAAIDAGYSKAFSAIFDGNITTFFVGVILYSFGVGPIQGFAVTLMAGILVSMFCALVLSRLVFDYMVAERRMAVNFG